MDLGVYNVSYIVGLFGEPNQAKYTATWSAASTPAAS